MGESEQQELWERATECVTMSINWGWERRAWTWNLTVRPEGLTWGDAWRDSGTELALEDALDQMMRSLGRQVFS